MGRSMLLFIDGIINLFLGIILILYPPGIVNFLGLPETNTIFFQQLLGAVIVGISIGLFYEYIFSEVRRGGLGMQAAAVINLCGGSMLIFWLLKGDLGLSFAGTLILWIFTGLLFVISVLQIVRDKNKIYRS